MDFVRSWSDHYRKRTGKRFLWYPTVGLVRRCKPDLLALKPLCCRQIPPRYALGFWPFCAIGTISVKISPAEIWWLEKVMMPWTIPPLACPWLYLQSSFYFFCLSITGGLSDDIFWKLGNEKKILSEQKKELKFQYLIGLYNYNNLIFICQFTIAVLFRNIIFYFHKKIKNVYSIIERCVLLLWYYN